MESFSTALLLLIAISVVLLVYVIYIFFDQRSNLRFASPKSKWAPLIALVLIVIGFGNYFYNGQRTEDLGAAFVLVIFALMMAIGRSYLMTGEVKSAEQVLSSIANVTMDDVMAAAKICFAAPPALAAIGPKDGVEKAAAAFLKE